MLFVWGFWILLVQAADDSWDSPLFSMDFSSPSSTPVRDDSPIRMVSPVLHGNGDWDEDCRWRGRRFSSPIKIPSKGGEREKIVENNPLMWTRKRELKRRFPK